MRGSLGRWEEILVEINILICIYYIIYLLFKYYEVIYLDKCFVIFEGSFKYVCYIFKNYYEYLIWKRFFIYDLKLFV